MTRYASIWFPYLLTEYAVRKRPALSEVPFVMASSQRGRMIIEAANKHAAQKGIHPGMVLADCKAILPELQVLKTEPGRMEKLLYALAEWSIRYTPFAAVDLPDGLILDTTGCAHLWGGENEYLECIRMKLAGYGYTIQLAVADTIGAAWAAARFGTPLTVIHSGRQREVLRHFSPAALRLDVEILKRLKKLGLWRIDSFMDMPRTTLRRRFGPSLAFRLDQALGHEMEWILPVKPIEPYQERLCTPELIASATGIAIALEQLLEKLCRRFNAEGMGLRQAVFKAYRVDDNIQQIEIGTGHPSQNPVHLFRLFEHKIATMAPALGFELFILEAQKVETVTEEQGAIWNVSGQNNIKVAELLDRVASRTGQNAIKRYIPDAHYLPERSVKQAIPLWEKPANVWRTDWPRPIHLLHHPERIEVTATLPDYPPLLFRYKGVVYTVAKSDGPERIEQEWWLAEGLYRDYYCVEDNLGARYWLFRAGPYDADMPKWFIHGFFA
ncbi:MAG: nucleotidyltransferase [Flavobacterium sp. BFFFF1]|uniref:Y-family DNA polymerase n=1 Tax=Flavobacterium sp. BFFFF1 TaxID=2015557 RepID=UPI000BD363C3|nr:DNA polymerase Y family protein [Flavobacterium sp. BFFFF1]OYU80556.1 MAG: nucleotidyltransferase [Flavobacterium sp. BFFFF1]